MSLPVNKTSSMINIGLLFVAPVEVMVLVYPEYMLYVYADLNWNPGYTQPFIVDNTKGTDFLYADLQNFAILNWKLFHNGILVI